MSSPSVLILSPGFPAEMPLFTRALAEVGAKVYGIGDQPEAALAPEVREALHDYHRVSDLWTEESVVEEVRGWMRGKELDRVECLWEPGMLVAAHLREAFGIPGLTVEKTVPFRDKERMKEVLDEAGIRTPRHAKATNVDEMREAKERIGFPLIVKPIDGAGSADTYECRDDEQFEEAVKLTAHVPEVSVEEYIEGEEFTYDTVCVKGAIQFENVSWYRPKPLLMRLHGWLSPQNLCFRDLTMSEIQPGLAMGRQVIDALSFESGFTHMEWFLTPQGEAVFGEIGARPPGARLVHAMNYSCDIDLFRGWAEAICYGKFTQNTEKPFNSGMVFKRAQGDGRIQKIEGLEHLMARYGEHIVSVDLTPVGAPRRDWRQSVVGDGWVVARHPDLQQTLEMCNAISSELQLYAG